MNVYAGVYIQWRVSSCTHEVAFTSAHQVTYQVSNGQVYIADYGNDRIAVYEEDGRFLYSIGEQGTGPGKLTGPKGVAFYKDEKLIVSDHWNNRLQVFTPEGVWVWKLRNW